MKRKNFLLFPAGYEALIRPTGGPKTGGRYMADTAFPDHRCRRARRNGYAPFLAVCVMLGACAQEDDRAEGSEEAAQQSAQEWIEIPLPDGVYSEGAEVENGERIAIPIPASSALEYKLSMNEGDRIAYSWQAEGLTDPDFLLSEFHGHTERQPGEPGTVMFYRRETGASESGTLTAPFDGIHGWYLKNDTLDDIVVHLEVSGDYEIVPDQLQ